MKISNFDTCWIWDEPGINWQFNSAILPDLIIPNKFLCGRKISFRTKNCPNANIDCWLDKSDYIKQPEKRINVFDFRFWILTFKTLRKIPGEGCVCLKTTVEWIKDGFLKEMKLFAKPIQASDWMSFKMKRTQMKAKNLEWHIVITKNGFV